MDDHFLSDGIALSCHLARPTVAADRATALILCHGYPSTSIGASRSGADLPELADRIAGSMGWLVFTFSFRGCGESEGNFSLFGWIRDVEAAVDHLRDTEGVEHVWLAGFGTGGGLCISAAAGLGDRVVGVATLGAPAGFDEWAGHTRRLLQHSREVGVIRDPDFPPAPDAWAKEFKSVRPVDDATKLSSRPMLVVHGSDDETVPVFDARVIADAHGSAELRIIAGAGHAVRYDPRVVAMLLGWLDRESSSR